MKTDTVIRQEGMKILSDGLGLVEAERFITLILREPFNYTEWQYGLYDELSIEDLGARAKNLWEKTHG